jgi:hypothetical protein
VPELGADDETDSSGLSASHFALQRRRTGIPAHFPVAPDVRRSNLRSLAVGAILSHEIAILSYENVDAEGLGSLSFFEARARGGWASERYRYLWPS